MIAAIWIMLFLSFFAILFFGASAVMWFKAAWRTRDNSYILLGIVCLIGACFFTWLPFQGGQCLDLTCHTKHMAVYQLAPVKTFIFLGVAWLIVLSGIFVKHE